MDKVCILWRSSPTAQTINCLTYGHGGEIRVYARDAPAAPGGRPAGARAASASPTAGRR